MTFEFFCSLELRIPLAETERWLRLCEAMRQLLSERDVLEGYREHCARKQLALAQRQRGCAVGDAQFAYFQGAAVQAGNETEDWAGDAGELARLEKFHQAYRVTLPIEEE